jgi:hypothetical protein
MKKELTEIDIEQIILMAWVSQSWGLAQEVASCECSDNLNSFCKKDTINYASPY